MSKIEINRTELVWPGKYNEDGTRKEVPWVNLPFQVIETVNESRVDRGPSHASQLTLFDIWEGKEGSTFEEGWRNKLIWGDNLLVMSSLLEKFAGEIDLIYIDPPFATGADYKFNAQIGEEDLEATKEHSIIEEKAYRDTWGKGYASYLQILFNRLEVLRELLSENGSIYVHLDWRMSSFVRLLLDEIFGSDSYQREIIWRMGWVSGYKTQANNWIRNHDNILYYTKNPSSFTFNKIWIPYPPDYERWGGRPKGKGLAIEDIWGVHAGEKINSLAVISFAKENIGYPTQKPESLLERIIQVSSNEGDLVADFFCGSGTTMAVAEKMGRRWIGCDLSRWAVHVTRKRLLDIENCKPFEILNLGKYERKYWQGITFNEKDKEDQQMAIFQYISFILKLYQAEPLIGMEHLHGKKGKSVVHVGAVDAPVTIDEISDCIEECARLNITELHVVGWEWEMGLAGPNNDYRRGGLMHGIAKERGVKLYLFQIPREVMEQQAVDKGDIQFFELAYLESKVVLPEKLTVQVTLNDFVIPNTDLIPDEVRQKIKKWSDYIDYWAVDWNFRNDTFIQGWVSYRTRRDRKLKLATDNHTYDKAGKYRILLKVIDIFGNDTSQPIDVEVK